MFYKYITNTFYLMISAQYALLTGFICRSFIESTPNIDYTFLLQSYPLNTANIDWIGQGFENILWLYVSTHFK